MSSLARKHIQNGLERSRNQASLLKNPLTLFRKQRISPKTLPREIAAREDEEEETSEAEGGETKDQISVQALWKDWAHIRSVLGFMELHQRQA